MRLAVPMLLFGLIAVNAEAERPRESPSRLAGRLDFRIEPLVDLHYLVRTQSMKDERPPEWMRAAVDAAHAVSGPKRLDRPWALLDVSIALHAPSVREIRASIARLPDQTLRKPGAKYLAALERIQPTFVADHWPEHREVIGAAAAAVRAQLAGKDQLAIDFIANKLALRDPGHTVPVYLVASGPFPGAFTRRARDGAGIVFADVTRFSTPLLIETLLHEAVHVLDHASPGGASVLEQLRARLQQAGLPPSEPGFGDVPHTLMFVQAGETVRRLIDPAYNPYAHEYYSRVPAASAAVRGPWLAHLEGEIARDEALARIVSAYMTNRSPGR